MNDVDDSGPSPLHFERKDSGALRGALAHMGYFLRWNVRAQRAEFARQLNNGPEGSLTAWKPLNDRREARLRELIAERCSYRTQRGFSSLAFGQAAWEDAKNALLAGREVDPFCEWLEGLPPWDGEARIDFVLCHALDAVHSELTKWASRYLFLGAVERAYRPGSKHDTMVILVGPQGIGKSGLLRSVLPPEHPEWFSDSLDLSRPLKERVEATLGRVLIECSELVGMRRADVERVKAFVSAQDDGTVRLAWRKNPETMLRRFTMWGTSNTHDCVPYDPTGARRFVPIDCHKGSDIETYMAEDRPQLWAEALHRHREGEPAQLPRCLIADQAQTARTHQRQDEVLSARVDALPPKRSTLTDLALDVGLLDINADALALDPRARQRLTNELTAHGWRPDPERRQVNGKREQRHWLPPEPRCPVTPTRNSMK